MATTVPDSDFDVASSTIRDDMVTAWAIALHASSGGAEHGMHVLAVAAFDELRIARAAADAAR